MALTQAQLAARAGRLTASRIACLMTGDVEKILRLYREMTGEAVEEDLSDVWAVQLGAVTEALNLDWYEKKNNRLLAQRGEVIVHPTYDWAACTLDGFDTELQCPVECKHVGGREPMEVVIERYQPQCQWQMEVTGTKTCALSVIAGANEPVVIYLDRNAAYAREMVRRGADFMYCVDMRTPPKHWFKAVEAPGEPGRIRNMAGNNRWHDAAARWLSCKESAERFEEAKVIIKDMFEPEDKRLFGGGVRATRDRAGRISIRAGEE